MPDLPDRIRQIENLMGLIDKLDLEPAESVRLEAELLIAQSLAQIERHLAELKSREEWR